MCYNRFRKGALKEVLLEELPQNAKDPLDGYPFFLHLTVTHNLMIHIFRRVL